VPIFSGLFLLSDEQVMKRVQNNNDPQAFALLVNRWEGKIQRLCARMTGDVHRAEDLAQDVFMRVFINRNDFQYNARFGTYLRRIAINACHDHRRRVLRRPESQLNTNRPYQNIKEAAAESKSPQPDTAVVKRESAELVQKAVFELPQSYREVIVLRHYEGLKFREIAEVLDISMGTVKSRMFEALNKLRKLLTPTEPATINLQRYNDLKRKEKSL
jgi:RNA polymerase sigma-70 factor (ECF subfamily)